MFGLFGKQFFEFKYNNPSVIIIFVCMHLLYTEFLPCFYIYYILALKRFILQRRGQLLFIWIKNPYHISCAINSKLHKLNIKLYSITSSIISIKVYLYTSASFHYKHRSFAIVKSCSVMHIKHLIQKYHTTFGVESNSHQRQRKQT